MPVNLTAVKDHPVQILRNDGNAYGAKALREYEENHGVTFAALDNDALAEVREAYQASLAEIPNIGEHRAVDVRVLRALDALLGLD